jgi:hypothetical protein
MTQHIGMFPWQQENTEIIEAVFSTRSVVRCSKQDHLDVAVINVTGIWRQRYELGKQLQDLRIDIEPHEKLFIPNFHF